MWLTGQNTEIYVQFLLQIQHLTYGTNTNVYVIVSIWHTSLAARLRCNNADLLDNLYSRDYPRCNIDVENIEFVCIQCLSYDDICDKITDSIPLESWNTTTYYTEAKDIHLNYTGLYRLRHKTLFLIRKDLHRHVTVLKISCY